MWWILIILFFLFSVVASTLVYFSLMRLNEYELILIQFQEILEYASERLKVVDASGHFESDDEIGFIFEEVKQLQELLNGILTSEETEENSGAKENEKN